MHTRLDAVCAEGWAQWERFDTTVRLRDFHPFIAADYDLVRAALVEHRAPGQRFLEWGSATGIITIMADIVGFEAWGIELDSSLVGTARRLAAQFESNARFVAGSFIPSGFRWRSNHDVDGSVQTGDGPSGYLQIGRALDEFDVVFGYPWDGESSQMLDLMQQYGRSDALFLLHDTDAGVHAYRGGRKLSR